MFPSELSLFFSSMRVNNIRSVSVHQVRVGRAPRGLLTKDFVKGASARLRNYCQRRYIICLDEESLYSTLRHELTPRSAVQLNVYP